jgi:electron transfer flavoprotein alpha subunit
MEKVLFLSHTDASGALPRAALEALTAARDLASSPGATLAAAVFGANAGAAAIDARLGAAGAERVLATDGPAVEVPRFATDAAAATALVRAAGATIVVAPHTSRLARVMAAVSHRLGGRIDTHVAALHPGPAPSVTRWLYRQRIEATLRRRERPWILLVDPGGAPAWQPDGSPGAVEAVSVPAAVTRTRPIGERAPGSGASTIRPDAKLLFVAGAGWTKKQADGKIHGDEAEAFILGFLARAAASLGSSKSLVDQAGEGHAVLRFLSHLNQVGQTGATPRHPKGLATCCHGEEPHVVGWRFVRERRAVNLDPGCGWARGKADVLYVADAFRVMERVNALLVARAAARAAADVGRG